MEALVLSLLMWLAAHSDYQVVNKAPPPVYLVTPEVLTTMYYAQAGGGEGAPANRPKVDPRIHGYFSWADLPRGAIYLVRPEETPGAAGFADPTANPVFRERLLHELVHFAQHTSGIYARLDCPAQGEFDAYRLGGLYLRQLGVPDPLQGRMFWVRRFSAC